MSSDMAAPWHHTHLAVSSARTAGCAYGIGSDKGGNVLQKHHEQKRDLVLDVQQAVAQSFDTGLKLASFRKCVTRQACTEDQAEQCREPHTQSD